MPLHFHLWTGKEEHSARWGLCGKCHSQMGSFAIPIDITFERYGEYSTKAVGISFVNTISIPLRDVLARSSKTSREVKNNYPDTAGDYFHYVRILEGIRSPGSLIGAVGVTPWEWFTSLILEDGLLWSPC